MGFSSYINNKWNSLSVYKEDHDPLLDSIYDFVDVKINPSNPSQVYIATWQKGLVKYENNQMTIYNAGIGNSSIGENYYWPGRYFVSNLSYDAYGNLWMTNPLSQRPLSVLKKDGKWKSFAIPDLSSNFYKVDKLVATSWGDIWITNINSSNLYVYSYKGTLDAESDDDKDPFSLSNLVNEGNALTASNVVYCITEDRDGNLWVGTDAGPVVISNGRYFSDNSASAYKIKVALNTEDNSAVFLLESERINCIAVDGANRKWLGTQNSGVYLVSADGINQIKHFTAENSPLFTNTVIDIKINSNTGEVFFATDRGMISYRSDATKGSDEFGDVYVFPNPVREDYTGDIAITNLITDAIVKITDISGNLVYQTRAKGGQATWDGKNLRGMRVNTGVYLVFCSNDDGTKTFVTKLLFIH
jgi:ligand-binding sensor domain-containing protein